MITVAAGAGFGGGAHERPLVSQQAIIWIIYLAVFVGIFYFFMFRPQMNRQKEQLALLASLAVDDQVITAGGVYGTIRAISDDVLDLEVADGVIIKVAKAAVARKLEA